MTETISGASQPDVELIDRARALTPLLRASALESEASRRLCDSDIEALSDARMFELCVPKRLGGLQVNVRTLVDDLVTQFRMAKRDPRTRQGMRLFEVSRESVSAWLLFV